MKNSYNTRANDLLVLKLDHISLFLLLRGLNLGIVYLNYIFILKKFKFIFNLTPSRLDYQRGGLSKTQFEK